MLDIVGKTAPYLPMRFEAAAGECGASPELALLSRQTHALEFIASHLGELTSRAIELPVEMRPDYELATRRLLQEAV